MLKDVIQIVVGAFVGILMIYTYYATVPVVAFMRAENWSISEEAISADVSGYKVRDCTFINGSEVGYLTKSGVITQVPFHFEKDSKESKPSSHKFRIAFDRWVWDDQPDEEDYDVTVMATVKHDCDGDIVQTTVGPFKIPQEILKKR